MDTIIDTHNKFITISYKYYKEVSDKFGESSKNDKDKVYRIFPVSLNQLCKVFNVDGKFSSYNVYFNNIELFIIFKSIIIYINFLLIIKIIIIYFFI